MRKVIDLCLDMPMGAEALTNMLGAMCLDPLYRAYKKTYGSCCTGRTHGGGN